MWAYEKKLQYPVNIKNPNPALAKLIITQLGGPDGELGASLRYLSQRYAMPYSRRHPHRHWHRRIGAYGDDQRDRLPAHAQPHAGAD